MSESLVELYALTVDDSGKPLKWPPGKSVVLCVGVSVLRDSTKLKTVILKETQRRQYSGHNTALGYYTGQGP